MTTLKVYWREFRGGEKLVRKEKGLPERHLAIVWEGTDVWEGTEGGSTRKVWIAKLTENCYYRVGHGATKEEAKALVVAAKPWERFGPDVELQLDRVIRLPGRAKGDQA